MTSALYIEWAASHAQADADEAITLFMGVPTMYSMLINTYNAMGAEREAARRAARSLRLWVSGSAACPPTVHAAWKDIAGELWVCVK